MKITQVNWAIIINIVLSRCVMQNIYFLSMKDSSIGVASVKTWSGLDNLKTPMQT